MVEPKVIHFANTQVSFAQTSAGILQKATGYDKRNFGTLVRRSFGARNVYASEYDKKKVREATFKHYGVEFSQQAKEVREKTHITNLKKYGVENGVGSKQAQEKIYQTKKAGILSLHLKLRLSSSSDLKRSLAKTMSYINTRMTKGIFSTVTSMSGH